MKSILLRVVPLAAILLLGIGSVVQAPEKEEQTRQTAYEVVVHSFRVEGTDMTFIFDRDKTLLIDCSSDRDPDLITAYLKAQHITHLDYIICTEPPTAGGYPYSSVGVVFTPEADAAESELRRVSAGEGFSLGASDILFAETEDGLTAEMHYAGSVLRCVLQTEQPVKKTGEEQVTFREYSPDGRYVQLTAASLREILSL